jgi:ABC-type glycerol-3-phosphate transport system substrate-binding protein
MVTIRSVRVGLAALGLAVVLTACGNSASPGSNNSPSTTSTPQSTASNPTTACTIPQNNGGDHDADNNGGPSDGDGCDR